MVAWRRGALMVIDGGCTSSGRGFFLFGFGFFLLIPYRHDPMRLVMDFLCPWLEKNGGRQEIRRAHNQCAGEVRNCDKLGERPDLV